MNKSEIPANLIKREVYASRVEPFMRKPVVKVFTGQRRVGKSYMLYQHMKKILKEDPGAHIIYISLIPSSLHFTGLRTRMRVWINIFFMGATLSC